MTWKKRQERMSAADELEVGCLGGKNKETHTE